MHEKSQESRWKAKLKLVVEDFVKRALRWGATEANFEWKNSLVYLTPQPVFVERIP